MFIDVKKYQNEETIQGLSIETMIVMPILFLFVVLGFVYTWVYIFAILTAAVGFHLFYKTMKVCIEIGPKKAPLILDDIEN